MKLMVIARRMFEKCPLRREGNDLPIESLDLLVEMEIESRARAACAPVLALKRFEIGNRKVKVRGDHAHPQSSLHCLEQRRQGHSDPGAAHDACQTHAPLNRSLASRTMGNAIGAGERLGWFKE